MRFHRHVAALGAFALLPAFSFASVLIDWGNNVSADTNNEYISGGAVSFSTTAKRSPTAPVGAYTGVNYYGGATFTGTAVGIDQWKIVNAATTTGFTAGDDLFNFRVNTASVGAMGYAVLLWKQEDFTNFSTGGATVTDFSVRSRVAGSNISGDVRFIVVANGVTLISAPQTLSVSTGTTLTLGNLSAQSWFIYDPASSISSIGSAYSVSASSFDNVTMAGILLRQEKLISSGNMSIVLQSVGINGVASVAAVPEPSSFAALAGLAGLGCALRRRRRA